MKKQAIFSRLVIPLVIVLCLLPPVSCFVFSISAKQYAEEEARKDLATLQAKVIPLMERSLSDENTVDQDDPVLAFLRQVSLVSSRAEGDAQLMIAAAHMGVIYPRDEDSRELLSPLAEEFVQAYTDDSLPETMTISTKSGETYLVNVYKAPIRSERIRYIITYCPASEIGSWIRQASVMVLVISSLFVLVALLVLWLAARSITHPLHRLCREATRIGEGDFTKIETEFSLREPEELCLAMNQMSEQLRQADEGQKTFFQNVSHELRNPLMSISGYAEGIEKGIFSTPETAAHTILEESLRLTGVVNSLLTLSRLDREEHSVDLTAISMRDVLEDVLDRVNGAAIQKSVTLSLAPVDPSMQVIGEEELLAQILENLLTNAIRYAKHSVTVAVQMETDYAAISVTDDGDGIDEKDLPHLFERCYKGRGGKFGLGLAIAEAAAKKMNGTLEAGNSALGGAIFTLRLRRG